MHFHSNSDFLNFEGYKHNIFFRFLSVKFLEKNIENFIPRKLFWQIRKSIIRHKNFLQIGKHTHFFWYFLQSITTKIDCDKVVKGFQSFIWNCSKFGNSNITFNLVFYYYYLETHSYTRDKSLILKKLRFQSYLIEL